MKAERAYPVSRDLGFTLDLSLFQYNMRTWVRLVYLKHFFNLRKVFQNKILPRNKKKSDKRKTSLNSGGKKKSPKLPPKFTLIMFNFYSQKIAHFFPTLTIWLNRL
jgi:hypothetical protein